MRSIAKAFDCIFIFLCLCRFKFFSISFFIRFCFRFARCYSVVCIVCCCFFFLLLLFLLSLILYPFQSGIVLSIRLNWYRQWSCVQCESIWVFVQFSFAISLSLSLLLTRVLHSCKIYSRIRFDVARTRQHF